MIPVISSPASPRASQLRTALCLLVVGAVLWPLTWPKERDSFPLSNYPMFARGRKNPLLSVTYAVWFDSAQNRHFVSPELLGAHEVLQARAILEVARAEGKPALQNLCNKVLATLRLGGSSDVTRVEIVKAKHDAVEYFANGKLAAEKGLMQCSAPIGQVGDL